MLLFVSKLAKVLTSSGARIIQDIGECINFTAQDGFSIQTYALSEHQEEVASLMFSKDTCYLAIRVSAEKCWLLWMKMSDA